MRLVGIGLLLSVLGISAAGCIPEGSAFAQCRVDADCASDEQCTRTRECISGTLVDARLFWTVEGQSVSIDDAAACEEAGIGDLAVTFAGPGTGNVTYQPVPCELGQVTYDKMPPRFDRVSLEAFGETGGLRWSESEPIAPGENLIEHDIRFR